MRKEISMVLRFCFLIVFLGGFQIAGVANLRKSDDTLLKTPIDGSKVVAENTFETIVKLASVYKLRVGYEGRTGDTSAGKSKKAERQIALFRGTLEEFLNYLLQVEPRYAWTYQDGVIDIFPASQRDSKMVEILDTRVKEFTLRTTSGVLDAGNTICYMPEVAAKLTDLGLTPIHFYQNNELQRARPQKPFVTLKDKKVRDLLNELLRYNDATIWTISRWGTDNDLLTITLR